MFSTAIHSILSTNSGVITTAEANSLGISNERLRLLTNANKLERVAHGVYISAGEFLDKMYVMQLRRAKMIYSHETALFLHSLTDRDPINYTVTVPTGYNSKGLRENGINVYAIKKDFHKLGVTKATTIFGNIVTTYTIERTICDCIRNRNTMDLSIITDAMKRYAKRSDKNLNTLMEIAEIFCITKPLRNYMEVLL